MISPSSGTKMPASRLIIVDLPAPFSPNRTCASPRRTSRETPRSAMTPGNRLPTAFNFKMTSFIAFTEASNSLSQGERRDAHAPFPRQSRARAPCLEIGDGDQLDVGLDPAGEFFARQLPKTIVDSERGHLRAILLDGR